MVKDNSKFAKEFVQEAAKRGSSKSMADAVGMPDKEDVFLLRQLITIYEQKTGGLLAQTITNARREFEGSIYGSTRNKFGIVNTQSQMRYDFELPESFVTAVEKHWPTMFIDKKHYAWFKKNLAGLMIRPNK